MGVRHPPTGLLETTLYGVAPAAGAVVLTALGYAAMRNVNPQAATRRTALWALGGVAGLVAFSAVASTLGLFY